MEICLKLVAQDSFLLVTYWYCWFFSSYVSNCFHTYLARDHSYIVTSRLLFTLHDMLRPNVLSSGLLPVQRPLGLNRFVAPSTNHEFTNRPFQYSLSNDSLTGITQFNHSCLLQVLIILFFNLNMHNILM